MQSTFRSKTSNSFLPVQECL